MRIEETIPFRLWRSELRKTANKNDWGGLLRKEQEVEESAEGGTKAK